MNYIPAIADGIIRIAVAVIMVFCTYIVPKYIMPVLTNTVLPAVKSNHVYTVVRRLVYAAEKLCETGSIPTGQKKQWVVDNLSKMGITVTAEVEILIEAAVTELENSVAGIISTIVTEAINEETETNQE